MIRSLGILGIILLSLGFIFVKPPIGVLMWTWVSVMNPHRLTYGFIYNFPVAYIIGLATIAGWLLSKEPKKIPITPVTGLLITYILWVTFTSIVAVYDDPWSKWTVFIKIQIFAFVTLALMNTPNRLKALIWMNVLCLGYFALKGGAFTILSGGSSRVWGPPGSFIADNNQLALAFVMTMPLLRYLQMEAKDKRLKWALGGAMLLWLLAIMGTQSRGALVAMACMLAFLWVKSKQKFYTGLVLVFAVGAALLFMPASWHQRMETIQDYNEDASFMGRVVMWEFALDVVHDRPITGGGFDVFYDQGLRDRYLKPGEEGRAVHNIYFEVLGEHGYVGLLLFLSLGVTAFFTCSRILRQTGKRPDLFWANRLAAMLQVCLVGYAINGLTLNLATFDLYYTILIIITILRLQVSRILAGAPYAPPVIEAGKKGWAPEGVVTTRP
jgi:probable O-glycosylation ligase (exosortase A-associated)